MKIHSTHAAAWFAAVATLLALPALSIDSDPYHRGVIGVSWMNQTYGPDGPWYAVQVNMGGNSSSLGPFKVPMYPTTDLYSHVVPSQWCDIGTIPKPSTCSNKTQVYIPQGTDKYMYYGEASPNTTYLAPLPGIEVDTEWMGIWALQRASDIYWDNFGSWPFRIGNISWGVQETAMKGVVIQYPGVTIHPSVGALSLGSSNLTFSFMHIASGVWTDYTSGANSYYRTGKTKSASFGLHIGAAGVGLLPSLTMGGYDINRLVGPASTIQVASQGPDAMYEYATQPRWTTTLQSVSYGTATGGKVFASEGQNLLPGGVSLTLDIVPEVPYMVLPRQMCDALTAQLPVTWDYRTGLYLWNQASPDYAKIVQSPGYLAFRFNQDALTINVPMMLLNMTLDPPLAGGTASVPYFPCFAQTNPAQGYALGRAFLQAAFVGGNWQPTNNRTSYWFMAQAPGPMGLPAQPQLVDIDDTQTRISSSSNPWASSWDGVWKPLAQDSIASSSTDSPQDGSGGLGKGAIAGIAVGVVVGVGLVAALLFFFLRKRRLAAQAVASEEAGANGDSKDEKRESHFMSPPPYQAKDGGQALQPTEGANTASELQAIDNTERMELAGSSSAAHVDLGGAVGERSVYEMPSPPTSYEMPSPMQGHARPISELM